MRRYYFKDLARSYPKYFLALLKFVHGISRQQRLRSNKSKSKVPHGFFPQLWNQLIFHRQFLDCIEQSRSEVRNRLKMRWSENARLTSLEKEIDIGWTFKVDGPNHERSVELESIISDSFARMQEIQDLVKHLDICSVSSNWNYFDYSSILSAKVYPLNVYQKLQNVFVRKIFRWFSVWLSFSIKPSIRLWLLTTSSVTDISGIKNEDQYPNGSVFLGRTYRGVRRLFWTNWKSLELFWKDMMNSLVKTEHEGEIDPKELRSTLFSKVEKCLLNRKARVSQKGQNRKTICKQKDLIYFTSMSIR